MNHEQLLEEVIKIAQAAGERILKIYEGEFEVVDKDDASPLTEADMASHHYIADQLPRLTPALPVVSEESEAAAGRHSEIALWIVDPLDGTKEFIKKNGEFTVNIALIEEGEPTLGVVHAPALGITYAGYDSRAFKTAGDDRQSITARAGDSPPLKVVASRSHRDEHLDAFLANLGEHELLSSGSSLKLCLVAEGNAHLYPRLAPTMEWDTAAGDAIIRAAGGGVYQLNGQPLVYNKADLHNPFFMAASHDAPEWLPELPSLPSG